MKASVINEYVLDTATASATDWVVTFPTKWAYVDNKGTCRVGAVPERLRRRPVRATTS